MRVALPTVQVTPAAFPKDAPTATHTMHPGKLTR